MMNAEDVKTHKDFLMFLAQATADLMAKKYNLSFNQAWSLFKKSETYKGLMNADDEYDQEMPEDVLDLWRNERLFGTKTDSESIAYRILEGVELG